jgi:hypothetical protein
LFGVINSIVVVDQLLHAHPSPQMEVLPILSFEVLPRRVVHSASVVMEKIDHQMTDHVGQDHRSGVDCIDAMMRKKNR